MRLQAEVSQGVQSPNMKRSGAPEVGLSWGGGHWRGQ